MTEPARLLPELFTVQEVAGALRLHIRTVYRLIEDGALPASRIGRGQGGVRISADDVTAYIASRAIRPKDTAAAEG